MAGMVMAALGAVDLEPEIRVIRCQHSEEGDHPKSRGLPGTLAFFYLFTASIAVSLKS